MSAIAECIYLKRTLDSFNGIPDGCLKLWRAMLIATKGGTQAAFASAAWYCAQIGKTRSTYYRQRAQLVALGLVSVETRKLAARHNNTSLIWLGQKLATTTKQLWQSLQLLTRPKYGTQKPVLNQNCSVRSKPELQRQNALPLLDQFAPSRMTLAEAMRSSRGA